MIDSGNMTEVLIDFPKMLIDGLKLGKDIKFNDVNDIVIAGMGGSGYTGDLVKAYLFNTKLRINVVKDYNIPKFVDKNTLFFAISYSGNTEETVAAYRAAMRKGCKIVPISSGGKLEELAKLNGDNHIKVQDGIQPRLSTPYLFTAVMNVIANCGLVASPNDIVKKTSKELGLKQKGIETSGKELAKKLKGKTPIIYSSQKLLCLSEKWKTDINENAKTHAFYNMFSEFNHNEICSYENPVGNFHVVILNDADDHIRVKKRIDIFKKLLGEYNTPVQEIAIKGDNYLTRLFTTVWMGLYVAYNLALEYNIDPTPVKIIESLKKDLK
jgi:glucose/mannose-6-phosphate isomerase